MNVKELIEILKDQDPDTEIVIQGDAEGNNYMILENYWNGGFNVDNEEAGLMELTGQLKKEGYTEEDVVENGITALFLWG